MTTQKMKELIDKYIIDINDLAIRSQLNVLTINQIINGDSKNIDGKVLEKVEQELINIIKELHQETFNMNVKTLTTSYDIYELENMLHNKELRGCFSIGEVRRAIKQYDNSNFKSLRENILKERKVKSYEVTLIIDDYGEEVFPDDKQSLEEYLKDLNLERIDIKKITKISDFY